MVPPGAARHALPDGRTLWLLPERAAWLAEEGLLLVADIHFGKAASFRRLGVPVPQGTTEANLARLDALLDRLPDTRGLVFLGDFLHAASGRATATLQALHSWRERRAGLRLTLVRGNHDARAGDPPAVWAMALVDEPWHFGPLALCHHPQEVPGRAAIAGHAPLRQSPATIVSLQGFLPGWFAPVHTGAFFWSAAPLCVPFTPVAGAAQILVQRVFR
jgi:DNA ligase-associated metallophosphoesterase